MSFLLEQYNWIWLIVAVVSGGLLMWPRLSGRQNGVTPPQAVQMINREKAVVIDVCEPAEFASGHVVGARNVPVAQVEASKDLPSNKSLPVIVVCASGARAARAAGLLHKRGHERVHVLGGGLRAWREAGLPLEKSA